MQNTTQQSPNISQEANQFGNYSDWAYKQLQGGSSLQNVESALHQDVGYTPPAQTQSQPQSHGNWFDRLLPTIGGIGGGILGSLAMPFLGTAAGSGIGGALGQELENYLTGSKGSTMASGLENAAGGLLGDVGGSLLGGVIGKAGDIAGTGASKLFSAQGPGIGEDLANFATKNLGINDLPTASKFADVLTGNPSIDSEGGYISKLVADYAKNDPTKTDITDIMPAQSGKSMNAQRAQAMAREFDTNNLAEKSISSNGLSRTSQGNAVRDQISSLLDMVKNPASASKEELFNVQKQAASLASTASQDAAKSNDALALSKARVLNEINGALKDRLGFDNVKVDPKIANVLASDIRENGSAISQQGAKTVADEIMSRANSPEGLTVGQLRNMESNFVQLKSAAQDAIRLKDRNFGASTADLLPLTGSIVGAGGKGSLAGSLAGLATSSSKLDALASKGLGGVSKVLGSNIVKKGVPLMTRAAVTAAANLPNIASSITPTNGSAILSKLQNGQNNNNNNQNGGNGMNGQGNALQDIIQAGILDPNQYGSLLQALAPTMQKAQVAQNEMSMLPQLYAQGGGGQGLMGGLLSNIEGLIPGTNQYNYMQARNVAAKAGAPFGITPGFMPSFMQSPMGAQSLFNTNQGLLSGLAS